MNSESEIQNSKSKIRNSASADALVEVRGLKKYFPVTSGAIARRVVGWVKAVDDVSFSIRRGETLGLVGESGCGKTTTGRCVIQLERPPAGSGRVEGRDLVARGAGCLRARARRRAACCSKAATLSRSAPRSCGRSDAGCRSFFKIPTARS